MPRADSVWKFIEITARAIWEFVWQTKVSNKITFENLDHGALKIKYDLQDCNVYIIFNPSKDNFMYEFENYVNLVFNDSGIINDGGFFMKMAIVNALSFNIFYEKKTVKVSPDYKEVN
jgi:hypothetical protein